MTPEILVILGSIALLAAIHIYVLYDERRFQEHLRARREARWPKPPPIIDPYMQMKAAREAHYFGWLTKPLEDEKPMP